MGIYGNLPGLNVKEKSSLASEFNQHLINKSMNLRSEVDFPDDLIDFKACEGKCVIDGLNSCEKFSLSFGQKSDFDTFNQELFVEFNKKYLKQKDSKSYFEMLDNY